MPTEYSPSGGRSKSTLGAQQGVGDLGEDARAVAGVRLGAGGAAVVEVVQRGQALRRRWRGDRRPRASATKATPQASLSFAGS